MKRPVPLALRITLTAVFLVFAVLILIYLYRDYLFRPWTRDGQVRAQIIQIAPRVSGPVVELPITDNSFVKKGDLLFRIDPRTYQAAVEEARASLLSAQAGEAEAKAESDLANGIYRRDKGAISRLTLLQRGNALDAAQARVMSARANLQVAELNLEFAEVRAPADGYVTHLRLQPGSQTNANQPALALVDVGTFHVCGFFKETQIRNVRSGAPAVVKLMSYPDKPMQGVVESIGWGIAQQNGSPGVDLLPSVNPTFDWIRLAQRIPVRVRLIRIPEGLELRVGVTASVFIDTGQVTDVPGRESPS